MGMKSVRELTDASIEHDMLNYMEKLIRDVEGVVEARKIRCGVHCSAMFACCRELSSHPLVTCVVKPGPGRWELTAL
jgi:hypothetical protein